MSLFDSLRSMFGGSSDSPYHIEYVGPTVSDVMGFGPEDLFRTQPHLRTVISFLARNVAQLPLQVFERVSDTDRRRVTDGPLADLLKRPNVRMTTFDIIYQLMADFALYDEAIWVVTQDVELDRLAIYPVSPSWVVELSGGTAWEPDLLVFANPKTGRRAEVPMSQVVRFHGWDPGRPRHGTSPVRALKQILAEQIQAWSYREQVWQRGGRVGTYLIRPKDAPWSPEARKQFAKDWAAKWTGRNGPKAGGTPILEDGMELKSVRFNAREEEWSEVAKLSLATVAAVYHTSPTMVGVLDNANYSNVKEFARMLYTDTLGPYLAMIEQRLNSILVPMVEPDSSSYVEFNIQAKMAGSFEEQAQVLSTSVGAPWMSRNEARARLNMPRIEGGDEIVTPLNVLIGGQASPQDSGSQNIVSAPEPAVKSGAILSRETAAEPLHVKAEPREEDSRVAANVLRKFFQRQRRVVLSELGSKDPDWWDEQRWDKELADDLYALAMTVSTEIGEQAMRDLGFDPDQYSAARTEKFLRAVAESRAGAINSTTRDQIKAALAGDLDEEAEMSTPAGVFDVAEESRADQSGVTLATTLATFAVTEAGKQTGRSGVTKTWTVTSGNPRPSHAAMNGETVGIDDTFSNGAAWPGDANLDVDEVANCSCVVDITIP